MRLTFRVKLLSIVGMALLALLVMLAVSAWMGARQMQGLADVEGRLVPKLEVGPQLDAEFERLSRAMQDAVAAQDSAALAATVDQRAKLFELIGRAGGALEPSAAAGLRWAIQDYFESARDVSRRMIDGEVGETLVQDARRMQERQAKARSLIKKATALDRSEIASTFATLREANRSADRFRLAIGALGVALVGMLSIWISRGMFQVLSHLSAGFARFGTGDFTSEIPVVGADELGAISKEANQMAASLGQHAAERAHADWLRAGQAGLSDELRGELEPDLVAERALSFLARRIDALAAVMYLKADDGKLRLYGRFADADETADAGFVSTFREGEGLVGEAFASDELLVVDEPPAGYLKIRSGLGECEPRTLLFSPLSHAGRKLGVLEFALLKPCTAAVRELLLSIRPTLAIALEAARASAAVRALLAETQALAEQLSSQEEELRVNNQELLAQQEELRSANEALEEQRRALRDQNEQLEEARLGLQQKAQELTQVSSYKSQFLANMSHELRTPLNSMLLLSHLLAENETGNLNARQIEHMKTIHGAGQDLLALINQVLDLSKIEAGKQEVELEEAALENFIAHARRTFEPIAAERGLSLRCELEPGLPATLTTDRQRVERVLINLVSNALKFTERGSVTLRIARPSPALPVKNRELAGAGAIAFSVTDTGAGIAPEAQERVFAPFEQLEGNAHRRYAGTGLGLAIARESVTLLGGELVLESQLGKGSTFTCVLPERAAPAPQTSLSPARTEARRLADDRASLAAQGDHLLLIEDDPVLAEQLVDIIHARRMKVIVATTGREGLELARQNKPLGIILDVKLPDVDGWTVMEQLKRDAATRTVPVHFVSGVDAPQRGLALGAVGYLLKPATHAELAGVVRVLAPAKQGSQRILVVEDDARAGESILSLLRREGFDADRVFSAEAALEALRHGAFGCIILDLGLPEMDGLGLLERLRDGSEHGVPRVVVHTGRALTKLETRQLEAYSEAVVLKDGSSAQRLLEEVRLFVRYVREALPEEQRAPSEQPGSGVSLEGVRLLLAEDDMRTVYALSALLRGKGADVLVAENGREALELLDAHPTVRGVLMDVMMPEMDGYEAMRRLRQDARFTGLPVIALTAKAMKGERERCLQAGASDYLTKPIDSDKLLGTLEHWLNGGAANGAAE